MNNIFSLNRLKLLFQKDWTENKKIYLLAVPTCIIIIILIYLTWSNFNQDIESAKANEHRFYFLGRYQNEEIYVNGWVIISLLAIIWRGYKLANRKSLTEFLLVPATASEKLIFSWIWAFPLLFITYTFLFQIIDYVFISNYIEILKAENMRHLVKKLHFFNISHFFNDNWRVMGTFTLIFSALLLSPFMFKKYAIIKGVIIIPICTILLKTINDSIVLHYTFPFLQEVNGLYFQMYWKIGYYSGVDTLSLNKKQELLMGLVIFGIVPLLLWLANWYKIKEKQI